MKTYSQTKGEKKFDWFKALALPCSKIPDSGKLANLASDWVTCACGNQCSIIPRYHSGVPKDEQLHDLGTTFYEKISLMEDAIWESNPRTANNYRRSALSILDKIETRSAQLIAEIKKAKNK